MPLTLITQHLVIAAPAADVWDLISTPGHLAGCHPFCAANPVDRWPGAGSVDHVEYFNGRKITRRFIDWREGSGYDIEITDDTGLVAEVQWDLTGNGSSSSLAITIDAYLFQGAPRALRWISHILLVRPMLQRYLRSVLQGIEWRITVGRPVSPSQFGRHAWFSGTV